MNILGQDGWSHVDLVFRDVGPELRDLLYFPKGNWRSNLNLANYIFSILVDFHSRKVLGDNFLCSLKVHRALDRVLCWVFPVQQCYARFSCKEDCNEPLKIIRYIVFPIFLHWKLQRKTYLFQYVHIVCSSKLKGEVWRTLQHRVRWWRVQVWQMIFFVFVWPGG